MSEANGSRFLQRRGSTRALLQAAAWVLCLGCNAIDSARLSPLEISGPEDDGGLDRDGGAMRDAGPAQRECLGIDELDTCTRPNSVTVCNDGDCLIVQCVEGHVDCDGQTSNGCEGTLNSMENCGFCRAPCALANAQTSCEEGTCELIECLPGFGDCDAEPTNGCETELSTRQDCGACDMTCGAVTNGVAGCVDSTCGVGSCAGGYGDCDEKAGNGCEQPLVGDEHCGGCGQSCEPDSAIGDCESGSCIVVDCVDGYDDCNGLPGDGCEASENTPLDCGRCGAACALPHAEVMACDTSGAAGTCVVDHACPAGASGCDDGALENGCEAGYGDCNQVASDGCEASLTSLVNCGTCGDPCSITNAITSCATGACVQTGCEPGFGQCVAGGPCISLATDEDNCGVCGEECDTDESCYGGRCTTATCAADRADCDGDGSCERVLTSTDDCGQCGLRCALDDATAACQLGRCTVATCNPGFEDCDGADHNGCEVDIRTNDACGSCTTSCFIPGAQASCSTGTCDFDECNEGRDNCNPDDEDLADGCETNITLPADCGACGVDCGDLPNVLNGGCDSMQCEIICRPGFADCDTRAENGCESDLASPASCGECGVNCTGLANVVSASCGDQGCEDIVCRTGFDDCDEQAPGCEADLRSLDHCGGCDVTCALPHATESCTTGECAITTCDPGYADCDGEAENGCEASLGDSDTCGTCDKTCEDGWACTSGKCQCTEDAQCDEFEVCCNGECINTNGVCSWWPCPIASSRRDSTVNCDSCNSDCRLLGAQWCCSL